MVAMDKRSRAIATYKSKGFSGLLSKFFGFIYNRTIRRVLPKRTGEYNNVKVQDSKWFDSITPWHNRYKPTYESALVRGLNNYVEDGDTLVIVGGGIGVTTVHGARAAGNSGVVFTYEGSSEQVKKIRWVLEENSFPSKVVLKQAIVGTSIRLHGDGSGAERVSPAELPNCDVLELDCEGTEIEILENMSVSPHTILVETHGLFGSPSDEVSHVLNGLGYEVILKQVAEDTRRRFCERNDVYVLVAKRSNSVDEQ